VTAYQHGLFDDGHQRKEAGQELVKAHQTDEWKDAVMGIIERLADAGTFTNDDVRGVAVAQMIGEPEHPNAWGAMVSAAQTAGTIETCGYTTSTQASRHGSVMRIWRRKTGGASS